LGTRGWRLDGQNICLAKKEANWKTRRLVVKLRIINYR
jgi:hypothetical protein